MTQTLQSEIAKYDPKRVRQLLFDLFNTLEITLPNGAKRTRRSPKWAVTYEGLVFTVGYLADCPIRCASCGELIDALYLDQINDTARERLLEEIGEHQRTCPKRHRNHRRNNG